jgi:hypothetical protein
MQDSLNKADHFRKLADKYQVLAKLGRPAYLGDFYRRVATRYLLMAEKLPRPKGKFLVAPNVPDRERLQR